MGKIVMPFFLKNPKFVARNILTTPDRHLMERAIFIGSCLLHLGGGLCITPRWRSLYNSIGCWRTELFKQVISQQDRGLRAPSSSTQISSHMEDVARRPPSYFKIHFLVVGGRGTETPVLLLDTQPPHYTWRCYYKTGGPRPTFFTKSGYYLCIVKEKIVNLPMLKMLL